MAESKSRKRNDAPPADDYKTIAKQWAKAKRAKEAEDDEAARQGLPVGEERARLLERQQETLNERRRKAFDRRWGWTLAFWAWLLAVHAVAIYVFTSGFLLTRLVLEDKSACDMPPIDSAVAPLDPEKGCWHPKTFERAVVIVIDALRYDFTVPVESDRAEAYHNAFPYLHKLAVEQPRNAFLRPFIADPPTTTLQRLKGLTTGTLPTFIDAGSNFAGTAIGEDNLLMQLRDAGRKIAHLGDDTWWALFPGYFEPNISKPYDSFNVWDLHTVDSGVIDNIFPLLEAQKQGNSQWDLLIGHCLGVDHAGHRYGPDHAAMTAKLRQMDAFIQRVVEALDDDTLLVVMGDHGMDGKGDHGGESDDEVEAALWMYSKRPQFGRTHKDYAVPPPTAKVRPVNQIDLVPTLALLLGIPIPYNSLGHPIEEAFSGPEGNDWANLASVSRMASAGIERYQAAYFQARGMSQGSEAGSPADFWAKANAAGLKSRDSYAAFSKFQEETLLVCKGLWARFDVPAMLIGVGIMAAGVVVLLMYASRDKDDDFVVMTDPELDYAEKRLELMAMKDEGDGEATTADEAAQDLHKKLLRGLWNPIVLLLLASVVSPTIFLLGLAESTTILALVVTITMIGTVAVALHRSGRTLLNMLPNTFWGWLSVVFTLSQSIGFASNSYTIWEDSTLLFFTTTFGFAAAVAAFRIPSRVDRAVAVYHSIAFVILGRVASYSKLCREEQMPYCTSTYYASVTSSTSATWQLAIPFIAAIALPPVIKSFLTPTKSYDGLAPMWIGYVFRAGLFMAASYWVVDAADNGDWFADKLPEGFVKAAGVYLAQLALAVALVAGTTAFIWAPPNVSIVTTATPSSSRGGGSGGSARVAILGYANAVGARYLLLPLNLLVACLVLTKPMGTGALALMAWQMLTLAELVDLLSLRSETIGPIILAVLGNLYFFKTGHQAVIASVQWDSAFIPLFTIRYPWTPLVVVLNSFGAQILAAAAVPLVSLWKVGPKQRGSLEAVARSLAVFIAYFAVEALATMSWAGHLRRHLMLYRVFNPRFLMAAILLLVLDVVVMVVTLLGFRTNALAVSEVFGWAD